MIEHYLPFFVISLFAFVFIAVFFKKGFRGSMRGMKEANLLGEIVCRKSVLLKQKIKFIN